MGKIKLRYMLLPLASHNGSPPQVIALIAHLIEAGKATRPFLILVPASLVANWEAELAAWAPSIQVVAYRGSMAEREEIFDSQARPGFFICLLAAWHSTKV